MNCIRKAASYKQHQTLCQSAFLACVLATASVLAAGVHRRLVTNSWYQSRRFKGQRRRHVIEAARALGGTEGEGKRFRNKDAASRQIAASLSIATPFSKPFPATPNPRFTPFTHPGCRPPPGGRHRARRQGVGELRQVASTHEDELP
ncbi:hypothetical protein GUJ93_ZPchr0012g20535 [Zizania palustris]|uniref:Uncharacterized protein n=1 Tax=Zizania palustris TaxID=103762 RepID=A0A8J5WSD2_ZIZPA|nr:hypothetical protein GUJ93_ZPchr0012g20878 [Zizania palustris]KAG8093379.1 hypothetical protein GUJ93_ZPchr0012g20535 [Zizania palustris]